MDRSPGHRPAGGGAGEDVPVNCKVDVREWTAWLAPLLAAGAACMAFVFQGG